ncbi:TPA: hypothetical protein ACYBJV_001509 [Neisseria meningitidis]|uniref:hypothetical protein n=1 Tax=Neisseria meningitidis TaxID=487 RepID=UPI0013E0A569|nr:hypothetical protein [Neisseria meningitidis]MBG9085097.1 hypothetical protein [Neisseria meningitidis]MBG9145351.1 hypothetical protein [Neisseria meningitidis]MBG9155797.1 hypothetical protein [Neisseria meningitidis]
MPSEAFQTAFAAFGHLKIPSFPRRRESEYIRTETCIPSFPRRRESSALSFSYLE